MKKQLTVALGLAVLATPAFASKARLQALGEDVNGSFYVNDNRNIFLNSAHVNNHKDLVTFEWGNTAAATDATGTPRAEGGVFRAHNNMVWGLYLGSESNTSNGFRAASGVAELEENNIDLFVGGDAGVKWGANVTYSKSADDEANADANQSAIRTRFGVIAGDIEGWANINVSNKAEGANGNEFEGKLGYKVGAIYNMNDYRIFADYQSFDGEAKPAAGGDFDLKSNQLQVGAGRVSKLNDKASLFTRAQVTMTKQDIEAGAAATDSKSTSVPVVIGLEYDAASWLVLRSSVSQAIWGTQEVNDNKSGLAETTTVNAGATLKFGELSVDGVIGNSAAGAGATAADTSVGNGNLRTDNLMSRVSMTYRF